MISEPWNPGFQDSRIALTLAICDWFQHVGYELYSVYVKKLDFEQRISKFHHSRKLPDIFWNSGYHLEVAIFLPILIYWTSIQHNFCHLTWFWAQKLENVISFNISCNFWILKWMTPENSKNLTFFNFRGKIHV